MLHPEHKLEYFKTAGWETEWIDTAEEIVRDQYNAKYASLPVAGTPQDAGSQEPEAATSSAVVRFKLCLSFFVF